MLEMIGERKLSPIYQGKEHYLLISPNLRLVTGCFVFWTHGDQHALFVISTSRFWAVANKTHLSVIRGALLVSKCCDHRLLFPEPGMAVRGEAVLAWEGSWLINQEVSTSR